jgi:predicted metal-binding protein
MVTSVQSSQNLKEQDSEKLLRIRHTCAHVLAMAVQKLYLETKIATGPVTETDCLSACKRPCAIAFTASNKTSLMFGDLPPLGSAAILQLGEPYGCKY